MLRCLGEVSIPGRLGLGYVLFYVPYSLRHSGRDLGKVFCASYMHEAIWEAPLVCVVHVYHYVI